MSSKPTRIINKPSKESRFSSGQKLGNFLLKDLIGSDKKAEVWKAENDFKHEFALKIIKIPQGSEHEEFLNTFAVFNKISNYTNLVRHENPTIFGEYLLLPMELLTGNIGSLKSDILGKGLKERFNFILKTVFPQICHGLQTCHNSGILHLNLKPSNVLYGNSGTKIKLCDYGLCKIKDSHGSTTNIITKGNLRYLAPELRSGKTGTSSSDFYSMGVLICELLYDEPYPVERADIPDQFNLILNKCLDINPSNRYNNSDEILADLVKIETNSKVEQKPSFQPTSKSFFEQLKEKEIIRKEQAVNFNQRFEEQANKIIGLVLVIFTGLVFIGVLVFLGIVFHNEFKVTPGEYFEDSKYEDFFYVFISQGRFEEAYERAGRAYPEHWEYLRGLVALAETDSLVREGKYKEARKVALTIYDNEKKKERLEVIDELMRE